jgi:Mg-chelatase subunit ChlD
MHMKKDYSHIHGILDRSGSMSAIRDDVVGGFNTYVVQQKQGPGDTTLSLIQFDSQDPYEVVHDFQPLAATPALTAQTYVPRANTPLLDALGRGIADLEGRLGKLPEDQRPEHLFFVIITDGMENASREYTRAQVEKMIQEKTQKEAWDFIYLSADFGAVQEARDMGIAHDRSLFFDKSGAGVRQAMSSASDRMMEKRRREKPAFGFVKEDRKKKEER